MDDEASTSIDGTALGNMRVVDLKHELEKRGMSKSGSKKDLVKRLKQQLEFEKLCKERKSGDFNPKLELDAEIQQNEFVQQYLAQQQRRYAEREEQKRLKLEASQQESSASKNESEEEVDRRTISDSDETSDEKQIKSKMVSKEFRNEYKDDTNTSEETAEKDERLSPVSERENKPENFEEANSSSFVPVTEEKKPIEDTDTNLDSKKEISPSLDNVIPSHSESESTEKHQEYSEHISENTKKDSATSVANESDDITEHVPGVCDKSFVEVGHKSPSALHSPDVDQPVEFSKFQSNSPSVSKEVRNTVSSPEKVSSDDVLIPELSVNMETSEFSQVPYSLSDIQLPDSPRNDLKSKNDENEKKGKIESDSERNAEPNNSLDYRNEPNGEAANDFNSSHADEISKSGTKRRIQYDEKHNDKKDIRKDVHSGDLSDGESDRNSSLYKKKSCNTDSSSNAAAESDENRVKDARSKDKKSLKKHQSDKRDSGKSQPKDTVSKDKKSLKKQQSDENDSDEDNPKYSVSKSKKSLEKQKQQSDESYSDENCPKDAISKDKKPLKKKLQQRNGSDSDENHPEDKKSLKKRQSDKSDSDENHSKTILNKDKKPLKKKLQQTDESDSDENHPKDKKALKKQHSDKSDSDENHPKATISKDKKSFKRRQSEESDSDKNHPKDTIIKDKMPLQRKLQVGQRDSKEDYQKDNISKDKKLLKKQQTDDNDSSSDSEKYSRHSDSKGKHRYTERKRDRNRSSSSSSSNSHSSDSSSKRLSKKSPAAKNKDTQNNENKIMSEKSPDDTSVEKHKRESLIESPSIPKESTKKRLKIKRDTVSLEFPLSIKELAEKNKTSKSEHIDPDCPSKLLPKEETKKRLKIKRDNVPLDLPLLKKESPEKVKSNKSDHVDAECSGKQLPKESTKIRLKIKRDNVLELPLLKRESAEKDKSNKSESDEKNNSSSHSECLSEKPHKEPSTKVKEAITEVTYKPRKITLLNRKLIRTMSEDTNAEPKSKKNKWESFASAQKTPDTVSISTDSLKNWFPEFKLVNETVPMDVEQEDHPSPAVDEKLTANASRTEICREKDLDTKEETSEIDMCNAESPAPNIEDPDIGPESKIIFIQNLVRPFTLNQLKELLKQSGNLVEEYFWIDKIKSKCFVMYETLKESFRARNALHNTRWPSSNPKILSVEFSDKETLEQHKRGNEAPPSKPPEPPALEPPSVSESRIPHSVEEHKRKDRERKKDRDRPKPQVPVREWDKDKIVQESPEREHIRKEEKTRSSEKREKKESKKRTSDDTPAKLLDDLFQKTKSPPCIYWLPLTEDQAKLKDEARKTRKLEREKRHQEQKEQEADRRGKRDRSRHRSREKENTRKSSTRSRSPITRRR